MKFKELSVGSQFRLDHPDRGPVFIKIGPDSARTAGEYENKQMSPHWTVCGVDKPVFHTLRISSKDVRDGEDIVLNRVEADTFIAVEIDDIKVNQVSRAWAHGDKKGVAELLMCASPHFTALVISRMTREKDRNRLVNLMTDLYLESPK